MRSRSVHVTVALALVLALPVLSGACSPASVGLGDTTVPQPTPIRTAPPDSTPTTPPATAYPTLPAVTAAPPPWAPAGWLASDVTQFLQVVADALDEQGAVADVNPYLGLATLDNGTKIDLTALARQLAAMPQTAWHDAVSAYLVTALGPKQPTDDATFEAAQPLLRVRVAKLSALGSAADQLVSQPVVGDLVAAVVVEQPTGDPTYLSPSQLTAWNKTANDVLAIALAQTLGRQATPQVNGIYTTLTDDPYASARLLDPTTVVKNVPAGGLVIAIPATNVFVAVAVDQTLGRAALTGLALQSRETFSGGVTPASNDLYWWRDGAMQVLTMQGDQLPIPPDLAALIQS